MEIQETSIQGVYIVKPTVFNDNRGFFFEAYNQSKYTCKNIRSEFIQDNISCSQKGAIRGLHYQLNPYSQAKLVQVIRGAVLDVVVDIRKNSPTYGKHFSIELTEENKLQLFVPRGMAHGFSVLANETLFFYKCDNIYNKASERGIKWNDPELGIDWKVPADKAIISAKDDLLLNFKEAEKNF
ncbi:MAG: dTDP-4-dehydrorhamnose 3,5-epimerase [Cytophagaceae bacterium]|jgi:dTDP-4-dehydrorhamnose 3,5-epimerase|nr:dTDP-4-dehydrorhamnose 3,5-epimerase [Cytophagaceae bacterium]